MMMVMEKINQDISVSQDSSRKQLAHSNGVIQKFMKKMGRITEVNKEWTTALEKTTMRSSYYLYALSYKGRD